MPKEVSVIDANGGSDSLVYCLTLLAFRHWSVELFVRVQRIFFGPMLATLGRSVASVCKAITSVTNTAMVLREVIDLYLNAMERKCSSYRQRRSKDYNTYSNTGVISSPPSHSGPPRRLKDVEGCCWGTPVES